MTTPAEDLDFAVAVIQHLRTVAARTGREPEGLLRKIEQDAGFALARLNHQDPPDLTGFEDDGDDPDEAPRLNWARRLLGWLSGRGRET